MNCDNPEPHPPHSFLIEGRIAAACPGVPEPTEEGQ